MGRIGGRPLCVDAERHRAWQFDELGDFAGTGFTWRRNRAGRIFRRYQYVRLQANDVDQRFFIVGAGSRRTARPRGQPYFERAEFVRNPFFNTRFYSYQLTCE